MCMNLEGIVEIWRSRVQLISYNRDRTKNFFGKIILFSVLNSCNTCLLQ